MINKIAVCGAGTMGSGIAQVTATAGIHTILFDVNEQVVESARSKLQAQLMMLVSKNKISDEQRQLIHSHLHFTSDISACTADLVIEAIVEDLNIKTSLFQQLETINTSSVLFASNTSSLSVSAIAAALKRPEQMAGLHFFNPAPLMKLVEVVQAERTKSDVVDQLVSFVKRLGKVPVVCKDAPGFIVNRVARPFYIESLRLAEEGIPFEMIDRVLMARGFKMGPFKLMDLIGNDVNYAVSCSVYDQLNKPERLKPSYIQQQKVQSGDLGKKTGKGYYNYNE